MTNIFETFFEFCFFSIINYLLHLPQKVSLVINSNSVHTEFIIIYKIYYQKTKHVCGRSNFHILLIFTSSFPK
jgi:hypothetical protein